MCGGARYIDANGRDWKIYFPNPKAALPVIRPGGQIEWISWGCRREENAPGFVSGGWARLDSIEAGKWAKNASERVLLAVISFMEKDAERKSHWIDLNHDQHIESLVVTIGTKRRLYVITQETPPEFAWVHDRWPSIVTASKAIS